MIRRYIFLSLLVGLYGHVGFADDITTPRSPNDAPIVVPPADVGSGSSAPGTTQAPGTRRDEGDFVTEKRNDGTTVKYKKKTSYDFEGANIDGLYNKPSGSYISNIKDVKAKSIIRIRENFDAEVVDSSRSLK